MKIGRMTVDFHGSKWVADLSPTNPAPSPPPLRRGVFRQRGHDGGRHSWLSPSHQLFAPRRHGHARLDEMCEAVPDRYNRESELRVDVKPGRNRLNFELR